MIVWGNFFERFSAVVSQGALVSKAIESLAKTPEALVHFFKEDINCELEKAKKRHSPLTDPAIIEAFKKDFFDSFDVLASAKAERLAKLHNSIRQNSVVMAVAMLEVFIKDVHREILRQDPTLFMGAKQVPLGQVYLKGFDAVLEKEIEEEVDTLDRKSLQERAQYFKDRLRIDYFPPSSPVTMEALKKVLDSRDRILHKEPAVSISESDELFVTLSCLSVGTHIFDQARKLYPKAFGTDPKLETAIIESMVKQLSPKKEG